MTCLERSTTSEMEFPSFIARVSIILLWETLCETVCIHSHQMPVFESLDPETGEGKAIAYTPMENMRENTSNMSRLAPLNLELSLSICCSLILQNLEHGSKLEKDIMGDTSGYYQRLLIMLIQVNHVTWNLSILKDMLPAQNMPWFWSGGSGLRLLIEGCEFKSQHCQDAKVSSLSKMFNPQLLSWILSHSLWIKIINKMQNNARHLVPLIPVVFLKKLANLLNTTSEITDFSY